MTQGEDALPTGHLTLKLQLQNLSSVGSRVPRDRMRRFYRMRQFQNIHFP